MVGVVKLKLNVLCVVIVVSSLLTEIADGADSAANPRKLSFQRFSGCPPSSDVCKNGTLIHIRSDSSEDSLHFIWNFYGCPSLILARTKLNAELKIDWNSFMSDQASSIKFSDSQDVLYSFGWSINLIWTFDDPEDKVRLDLVNQTTVRSFDTKNFLWQEDAGAFTNTTDVIKFTVITKEYDGSTFGNNGYINFTIQVRNTEGYSDILPYMLHNGNSSQVDVALNEVNINGSMTKTSRIGLGFLLVQEVSKAGEKTEDEDKIKLVVTPSLDDEYSPGVFEMVSLRTPVVNSYDSSYLEWKPISYIHEVRDITDAIDVIAYEPQLQVNVQLDDTLLWGYYGGNISNLIVQTANISFGTNGDKFYNATPHVSWTFMCGYGPPPADSVSMFVMITMAIGLGVPVLIIIVSIIYMATKRLSTPNDELLLGR